MQLNLEQISINRVHQLSEAKDKATIEKYWKLNLKDLYYYIVMSIYINLIYFLPILTGGERSTLCKMKTALSVGLFAWILTAPFILVHFMFCICFLTKKR